METTDSKSALWMSSPHSFFSPGIDFLMVGGLTFLLFPVSFLPAVAGIGADTLLFYALLISIFVNYPHFMHSYQLLYAGLGAKLFDRAASVAARLRYCVAGIMAPVAIAAILIVGVMQDTTVFLGYVVNLMFFLVGWHYVKQGYGVLMALSVRKNVFFSNSDKQLLLVNAYIVWLTAWVNSNTQGAQNYLNVSASGSNFKGIPFESIGIPDACGKLFILLMLAFLMITLMRIFETGKKFGTLPYNGLIGYFCALYFWIIAAAINPVVYMFVPALHSLQYLMFVWKMTYEKSKHHYAGSSAPSGASLQRRFLGQEFDHAGAKRFMVWFFVVGIIGGALGFELVPAFLAAFMAPAWPVMGPELSVFIFFVFINIHHYFIDFAIWRRENADMKFLFH